MGNAQTVDDTIGEFLVIHRPGPHVEHSDSIETQDFDVRQEAVYRCLCGFEKNGIDVCDETLIPTLIAHKNVAAGHLKNARIDAVRRLRGRGSQRGKDKRTFLLANFDHSHQQPNPEAQHATMDHDPCCPEAAQQFEDIENDFSDTLRRVYERSSATEQKAIRVLAEWQRRKECGQNTYPLRKTVHKLRARLQAEGSQFDLNPRFL